MTTRELLVGDVFRNASAAVPDRTAVILGDESFTFRQLDESANRVARALAELGLGRGDRLVVWSRTRLILATLFAAAAKMGVVYIPLNPMVGVEEAGAVIESSQATLLLADELRWERAIELGTRTSASVCSLGDLGALSIVHGKEDVSAEELTERDPHVVVYGGSDGGWLKGTVISHRTSSLRTQPGPLLDRRGAMVCSHLLSHWAAFTVALEQWQAREAVVLLPSSDAEAICQAIEQHQATRVSCIPAVWQRVLAYLDDAGTKRPDLSSLRYADVAAPSVAPALTSGMALACPTARIRVVYGTTEAGTIAVLEHEDILRKPASCGRQSPAAEVLIAEEGELLVRGPQLFDGYLGDAAATQLALKNGWYRTGDLAEVDDEGYLSVTGRVVVGASIVTGGESVVPGEVEAMLMGHPAVIDVAVIGLPDEQWGEVVCAAVVPKRRGKAPSLHEIDKFLEGRIDLFKLPRRIVVLDEIPRTAATHQVKREQLLERVLKGH